MSLSEIYPLVYPEEGVVTTNLETPKCTYPKFLNLINLSIVELSSREELINFTINTQILMRLMKNRPIAAMLFL
jgi:hypothetical protein